MIWLTWRQHRIEGLVTLGVLAVLGVFLLISGLAMAHDLQQSGLGTCLAHSSSLSSSSACGSLATLFLQQYGSLLPFAAALLLLPALLGVLVGAPLVAREYEQRTHLLVWMQSITRSRWLSVKLALVLGAGLLASGALLAMLIRWYTPFDQLVGKFNQIAFDFSGPVLIAATVMALAVGIAAGTVTRRTVPAILLTLALLVAIHVLVEFNLRANYEPQIVVTWPLGDLGPQSFNPPISLGREDWNLGEGFLDPRGNRTNGLYCNLPQDAGMPFQCAKDEGYRGHYLAYQPADRFWTFQWIETGIYLAISALAIAATAFLVRRRLS
jgi:ABC-type transport system involved in multi-copper enzyme maturation permease subunit